MNRAKSSGFLVFVTIAAAFGGLLFGYDTAVISGAVEPIRMHFIDPLFQDPMQASRVVIEFKNTLLLSTLLVLALSIYYFMRLYGRIRGLVFAAIVSAITGWLFYRQVFILPDEITPNLANSITGFTIASALLGCVIGGFFAGYISQRLGRRNGLILAALLFIVSAIGSALPEVVNVFGIEHISAFNLYRIIGGIGVGIASMLSPMYIAEIAPSHMRGRLVSCNQFCIIFGMLLVYFVNYFIARGQTTEWLSQYGWRWMLGSEIVPAFAFMALLLKTPETPRYLVMKGQTGRAMEVLEQINGSAAAQTILNEIRLSFQQSHREAPWLSYGGALILIAMLLSIFQQFVGINVVLYYAPEIFKNMGSQADVSLIQTIIVGAVNLIFTVVAIVLVDRIGRKPLMIIGALGMAVSMLGLGTAFYLQSLGITALLMMLVYVAAFAVSWGPVVWVLLSEIFPNSIRGALSIAVATQWLANLLVSWTFPMMNSNAWLTDLFNHGFAYWVYGVMGLLAAVFVWRWVPETKNKTLEEMNAAWSPRTPSASDLVAERA
ncbi:D-xylose transporter XylE [Pseudomonas luteola]|uniref:D-xylose transporter XylE n=1 Tax=Pseudomonas luteola TaxID=47886 RepID=UPI003DA11734